MLKQKEIFSSYQEMDTSRAYNGESTPCTGTSIPPVKFYRIHIEQMALSSMTKIKFSSTHEFKILLDQKNHLVNGQDL